MSNLDLSSLRIGALINTASGSSSESSAEEMMHILKRFGVTLVGQWCVHSDGLATALDEIRACSLDVLIVLGGDGTIRSAAINVGADKPYLVPLPGGTLNILPKALYGDVPWQEALEATLAHPALKPISGGQVSGEKFFISAICGAPALWAEAREALRARELSEAIKHGKEALAQVFSSKIHYRFDEMHEGDAEAVTVTCPLISSVLEEDRQVFETAVIEVNSVGEVLQLATKAAFGVWREDNHVATVRTPTIEVSSDTNVPIILDGETVEAGHTAEFKFVPHICTALVPEEV